MADPWEKYGAPKPAAKKPWERYTAPQAALPPGGGETAPVADSDADSFMDILKAGGAGIARGAADLPGLPGSLGGLLESGLSKGIEAVTGWKPAELPNPLSGEAFRGYLSDLTGGATDYRGEGRIARDVGTAGEFVPGAAAFGGTSIPNLLRFGVLPGIASEEAGRATEGTGAEPYARIAAALLAPAAASAASKLVTPFPASPDRLKMADILKREGVDLTAGQRTGSEKLRYMESELGGRAAQRAMERQGEQFTNAAMKRAGAAGRATADNMDALGQKLGQGFEAISARNVMRPDQAFVDDINKTVGRYGKLLETQQKPIIKDIVKDLSKRMKANGGTLPGPEYQTIRSDLSAAAKSASNQNLAGAFRGIRNALDDAMSRSVSPADADEWKLLRREYGNMKTLEKAATGAGESAAMGIISPSQLRNAAVAGRRGQYARGAGDFDELARAGEATMKPLPQSGTAPRTAARNLGLGGAGSLAGGLASIAMDGGSTATMIAMLTGALAPPAVGRMMMTGPGQAYLGNQMLGGTKMLDPRNMALISALLGQNASGRISQQ